MNPLTRGRLILISFLLLSIFACIIPDLPLEGHKCYYDNNTKSYQCLPGWTCDLQSMTCVKKSEKTPQKNIEKVSEKILETPKEQSEKILTKELQPDKELPDAADEINDIEPTEIPEKINTEKLETEKPNDTPPTQICPFSSNPKPELCPPPIPDGGDSSYYDCKTIRGGIKIASEKLPFSVAYAAAVSDQNTWGSRFQGAQPKAHIYLIGGKTNSGPSKSILAAEIDSFGQLGKWKKIGELNYPRIAPTAFLINGYIYVIGGTDGKGNPIKIVERAKADGLSTLTFETAGNWNSLTPKAGITYRNGFFYRIGGSNSNGKPDTTTEFTILLPNGKLGTPQKLPPLPKGKFGPLLSTHHFLLAVGPGETEQTLIAKIKPDGTISNWCSTTPIPQKISELNAITDGRNIYLHSIVKNNRPLKFLYFTSILGQNFTNGFIYGGSLDSWYCTDIPGAPAVLQTPRKGAAAVVAFDFLYLIGGEYRGNLLKNIEWGTLGDREPTCDMDLDGIPNSSDKCPEIYSPDNKKTHCSFRDMVLIPAGPFTQGTSKRPDEPLRQVTLHTFAIDKYEITNQQYEKCVKANACSPPKQVNSETRQQYYGSKKYANYPVIWISWKDARDFCNWIGKRLPTEAEWEKAARGPSGNLYPWGNSSPKCNLANYSPCKDKDTSPVQSFPKGKSPYGLYQMAGNVREWVSDYYSPNAYQKNPALNPKGPKTGNLRVVRGGSFLSSSDQLQASYRDKLPPTERTSNLGFRCAQSIYPTITVP